MIYDFIRHIFGQHAGSIRVEELPSETEILHLDGRNLTGMASQVLGNNLNNSNTVFII